MISLDFSWFLLISKNMYVISHSDLPLEFVVQSYDEVGATHDKYFTLL